MPNELQSALNDALDTLSDVAGVVFRFGSTTFTAWPSSDITDRKDFKGVTSSSPDALFWYQTKAAPVFKVNDELLSGGKKFTVSKRLPVDPYTGAFKFALLPGRSK